MSTCHLSLLREFTIRPPGLFIGPSEPTKGHLTSLLSVHLGLLNLLLWLLRAHLRFLRVTLVYSRPPESTNGSPMVLKGRSEPTKGQLVVPSNNFFQWSDTSTRSLVLRF